MSNLGTPIWSFISSCFDGATTAYIYLWISKKWQVIYVGQTSDRWGSFGRAYGHIQEQGTFRCRFEEIGIATLEEANDLVLVSYPLPQRPEFTGIESSYREAVEYLVQIGLRDIRGAVSPGFNLVSRVRATDRVSNSQIQRYAEEIVLDFQAKYPTI
jgi:hypothetical protein